MLGVLDQSIATLFERTAPVTEELLRNGCFKEVDEPTGRSFLRQSSVCRLLHDKCRRCRSPRTLGVNRLGLFVGQLESLHVAQCVSKGHLECLVKNLSVPNADSPERQFVAGKSPTAPVRSGLAAVADLAPTPPDRRQGHRDIDDNPAEPKAQRRPVPVEESKCHSATDIHEHAGERKRRSLSHLVSEFHGSSILTTVAYPEADVRDG